MDWLQDHIFTDCQSISNHWSCCILWYILEFQQTIFAVATSPHHSSVHLLQACLWTWIHGLLCNVSNQVMSRDEDTINHPWRPLPAGRVSQLQALQLRWLMVALCILWSAIYGRQLAFITLSLILVTFLYDEVGLSSHPFGKNACNACAYAAFELGVVTIMGIPYICSCSVIILLILCS